MEAEYITVREIAERLNLSKSRAYQLVESGDLPCIRIGSCIRIGRAAFESWLKTKSVAVPKKEES